MADISLASLKLVLTKLHLAGKVGVKQNEVISTMSPEEVEKLLQMLEDHRFVVSQRVGDERRYYHVSYY